MDLSLSLKEKMDPQTVGEAVDGVWPLLLVWDLGPCLCLRVDEVKIYCPGYLKLSMRFISIYLLIYFQVVSDRASLIIQWLHNLA